MSASTSEPLSITTIDEILAIYGQLDAARQRRFEEAVVDLVADQRAEETVRQHGALTMEQLGGMTVSELHHHASDIGAPVSAVVRVAEANV